MLQGIGYLNFLLLSLYKIRLYVFLLKLLERTHFWSILHVFLRFLQIAVYCLVLRRHYTKIVHSSVCLRMNASSMIRNYLHISIAEGYVLFELYPFCKFLHQGWPYKSGYHNNKQGNSPYKLFMLGINLETQSKSDGPSNKSRIPTYLQFFSIELNFFSK